MGLKDFYWNRWIRKHGCKVSDGVSTLRKQTTLQLEGGVRLGHLLIDAHQLSIGANTYIRSDCHLHFVSSVGRFCSIGSGAVLGQEKHTHPADWLSSHPFQFTNTDWVYEPKVDHAVIGHDVWIGHSAMIMEGVNVGTGAIIATRALVTHDVPPYAIVAGMPAKVIRYRHSPEIIDGLLKSEWWNLGLSELKRLPLNDPKACIEKMASAGHQDAFDYPKILVTRNGCRVI
ncbi:CatB-related O-acetyltransferase [Pseudomonas defluvii]|jgi:acetyltransferase-like isoleucine patch superfamily enzyme|nr:CatB-related O-acetyltransferase [Pseudomonas defluvii]